MDKYTIAEQAYKNGYAKGFNDAIAKFSEEVKEKMWQMCYDEDDCISYPFTFIDKIADELTR